MACHPSSHRSIRRIRLIRPIHRQRAATFPLSARRSGGEGRGEVGSSPATNATEFNAKTQRRKDATQQSSIFYPLFSPVSFAPLHLCAFALKISRLLFAYFAYFAVQSSHATESFSVLNPAAFAHHIEHFNSSDDEAIPTTISNKKSWSWLQDNIPIFECPDRDVEEIYYFRWWSFRKHIKRTPRGYVITEFLPTVSHAGEFNTISCAAGFHLAEGRWLRNQTYLNDYTRFWLRADNGRPQPHFHKFSSWFAAAAWDRYLVNGDARFITTLLNPLVADYRTWETEHQLPNGLFWQHDVKDAMEESISGSRTAKNIRPTINSYMLGNAQAVAAVSRLANKPRLAEEFTTKANNLKRLTQENLWDTNANFFKVLVATTNSSVPSGAFVPSLSLSPSAGERAGVRGYQFATAREALGFIPWMFGLPDTNTNHAAAFAQLTDPEGFLAPFGFTTAERRHPQFRNRGVGTCEWDGAIWPFATSQTLYALANYSRTTHHAPRTDYFSAFLTYTRSQHANGKPYIGEYLDETTGDWINRNNRSAHYNHSTYADLLITGIIGLIPRADDTVEISPLLPANTWDWFCLDGVKYHGHMLTVIWDKDGTRYGRGAGLRVLADGKQIAHAATLERVISKLP